MVTSRAFRKALALVWYLNADDEILTFRVYRGKDCIDEFTGTRGEWFDRMMDAAQPLGKKYNLDASISIT